MQPNLHLVVAPRLKEAHDFLAGFAPAVDEKACLHCGRCTNLCRFGAIEDGVISRPLACEGCGVCAFNCPAHAISMVDKKAGQWLVSDTRHGLLVHAELGLASITPETGSRGPPSAKSRRKSGAAAHYQRRPPGIASPTIAALTARTSSWAVTEPSLSGYMTLSGFSSSVAISAYLCGLHNKRYHVENTRLSWREHRKELRS
jgi:MinD superfamily P-loop ATPase